MKVIVTVKEIIEADEWLEFCNLIGWDPHSLNEGTVDENERVVLTEEQAKELNIL